MKNIGVKLLAVQKDLGTVKKGSINPFYNSSYVEINSLLKEVLPVLQKHGILLAQPLGGVDGKPAITTVLIDAESGETISGTAIMPEIADPQKAGGAITYFRRYGLLSILGLGSEDDDANAASGAAPKKKTTSAPKRKGAYL